KSLLPALRSEGWRTVDTVSAESGSRLSVAAYCVHTSLPVLVPGVPQPVVTGRDEPHCCGCDTGNLPPGRCATTNSNHNLPVAPNLLNQTFAPAAPNQVWVADLTYVATQEGWLYLAGIKDVYTCEIVGYAMGERMTKELTGKALFMALRSQRPPAGLIHHSDRGSQYCAYDYRVIQEQFGLKTSMSRKGNCYDNAPMESFWGTLKNESLSHYRFNNRDEAISVIREYIEIFYNRQRRHSRLGNISPAAFREKYHQMAA
ncbi:IS600, partial (plasmid) [Escherichia coli O157:H7 str. Sakai]